MALAGTAGYRSATNIPAAEAALQSAYTRHVFARATAVPSTANYQIAGSIRNGFNANFCHDDFAWNHQDGNFVRSHYHRSGSYVGAQMSAGSFAANTWISFAGTWDGSRVRSYVNGVLDGTSAVSSVPSAGDAQIAVNGSSDYGGVSSIFSSGQTAEQAIWDVVLTTDELASLAKGFRAPLIRPDRLVFYCPEVRGRQELIGGRTLNIATGSETVTDHPRVFG